MSISARILPNPSPVLPRHLITKNQLIDPSDTKHFYHLLFINYCYSFRLVTKLSNHSNIMYNVDVVLLYDE